MTNSDLTEAMYEKMINSSEVIPVSDLTDTIQEIELDRGQEFSLAEIYRSHYSAADRLIDSLIGNEYDTPEFSDSERDANIRLWELQRPCEVRRAKILAAIEQVEGMAK